MKEAPNPMQIRKLTQALIDCRILTADFHRILNNVMLRVMFESMKGME